MGLKSFPLLILSILLVGSFSGRLWSKGNSCDCTYTCYDSPSDCDTARKNCAKGQGCTY